MDKRRFRSRTALVLTLVLIVSLVVGVGTASASGFIEVSTGWRYVQAGVDNQEVGDITIDWSDPDKSHPYDIVKYPDARIEVDITITSDGVVFSDTGSNEISFILPGDEDPLPYTIGGSDLLVDVEDDVSGSINANIRVYYFADGQYKIDESFGDTIDKIDDGQIVVEPDQPPAPPSPSLTAVYVIGASTFTVNGAVQQSVNPSYIKEGRTYLAIRDIAAGLGIDPANVNWDGAKQVVTLTKGTKVVKVQIGSLIINVNGKTDVMDVAPETNHGRTMLPAAFVARAFGVTASWDAVTSTVTIK